MLNSSCVNMNLTAGPTIADTVTAQVVSLASTRADSAYVAGSVQRKRVWQDLCTWGRLRWSCPAHTGV